MTKNNLSNKIATNRNGVGFSATAIVMLGVGTSISWGQAMMSPMGSAFTLDPDTGEAIIAANGEQLVVPRGYYEIGPDGQIAVSSAWGQGGLPSATLGTMESVSASAGGWFQNITNMFGGSDTARDPGAGTDTGTLINPTSTQTTFAPPGAQAGTDAGFMGMGNNWLLIGGGVVAVGALLYFASEGDWFNDDTSDDTDDTTPVDTSDTIRGTYTFNTTTEDDTLTGTAADETFGATNSTISSSDIIDGGAGNDTLTIEYTYSTSSRTFNGSNITNIEKIVFQDILNQGFGSSDLVFQGISNIQLGTEIEFSGVAALTGQTINTVKEANYVYSAENGNSIGFPQTDELYVVRSEAGETIDLELGQLNPFETATTRDFSNVKFAAATTDTTLNYQFSATATGDIEIFSYDDATSHLDVSAFNLSASDFSTITGEPTTMTTRLQFDSTNKVLYIDVNADGSYADANDMKVGFVAATADLSATDFVF